MYRALHHLSIRDFTEAADLLVDSLSTFTATELMEYEEFVALTVLAAGVGLDRKGIKEKVCLFPGRTGMGLGEVCDGLRWAIEFGSEADCSRCIKPGKIVRAWGEGPAAYHYWEGGRRKAENLLWK